MGTKTILSSSPADAFSIAAGRGAVSTGGAVAFKPQQNFNLTSVTLLLREYTGENGQQIKMQLLGNDAGGSRPGDLISEAFLIPPPNDGSVAEFTFNLPANVALQADVIYWIFVYGEITDASFANGALLYWVTGGNPAGGADYVQSLLYAQNSFQPSTAIPAFTIKAAE